ncbi:serine hydroxymethyltransferase [Micromonospora aurantiaca (nom. illeg.)]|uniref:serine hydroxymethyltransferase n=1 Tax=Micromonospora aurantiaca (nom. illeg.) TaxID=47850 RepID=UPI003436D87F
MAAFDDDLADLDPAVAEAIGRELRRQHETLGMIASENLAPRAVLQAQGSALTNKYAEGYPGRRYYSGCEHVDDIERLAIDRAKRLFGAAYANVQPHSGSQANAAVMAALIEPGDTILGLDLAHAVSYRVGAENHLIDMDEVQELAREHRPKLLIAGWSAYPRTLDFARFRRIADQLGAYLLVDMAHFAGLVAAGLHPNPVPHAHVVTLTTHKTLGGPRGGTILSAYTDLARRLDSAVFPGQQGGPLAHVVAAKAVAFRIAGEPQFQDQQRRALTGAKIVADRLCAAEVAKAGIRVVSGGTDVHLVLVDLSHADLDGAQAERLLQGVGITVNRNAVPFDPRPPMVTSGLRIGTSGLATRGFSEADFTEVADIIADALTAKEADTSLRTRVARLVDRHPLHPGHTS